MSSNAYDFPKLPWEIISDSASKISADLYNWYFRSLSIHEEHFVLEHIATCIFPLDNLGWATGTFRATFLFVRIQLVKLDLIH